MQEDPHANVEPGFGKSVSAWREVRDVSQKELSEALAKRGVSLDPSALSRLEQGKRSVRLNEAVALADALGTSMDVLLGLNATPRRRLQRYRDVLEHARRDLREPIVNFIDALQSVEEHLRENPELLETLAEADTAAPSTADGYREWFLNRLRRFEQSDAAIATRDPDEWAWADPDDFDSLIAAVATVARMQLRDVEDYPEPEDEDDGE